MNDHPSQPPLSMRRIDAQRRIALQRAEIGSAWVEFEDAAARGERRARQVVTWARAASAVTAFVAASLSLRRLLRQGITGRALALLAIARGAGRVIGLVHSWSRVR